MQVSTLHRKKIAVIGSGISGLSCAWLLAKQHQVTLFEKDDRLGGHANTVAVEVDGKTINVDTGFIVYNPVNYPNLVALFEHLAVESCETDMSFGISINGGEIEYAGSGLATLFAQRRNILRPGFWRMLNDIRRFYQQADRLHTKASKEQLSLRQLLSSEGYSEPFIKQHLLPMGAAIWSTPMEKMLDYPATSFLRFCKNHGLLQVNDRPVWRTVINGSHEYIQKMAPAIDDIRLNSRVHRVVRDAKGIHINDLHGNSDTFDDVVFACHADQALAMLAKPTTQEQQLLQAFPYQRNRAYLHRDTDLMPQRRSVWSSWNYLADDQQEEQHVSVTYWMNQLQPLATDTPILVSLNPPNAPRPEHLLRSFFYDHPLFDQRSLQAQQQLWQLQGINNTWFCGAYFGYGFHEDGLQSGLAVAERIGHVARPWHVANANGRIFIDDTMNEAAHYG